MMSLSQILVIAIACLHVVICAPAHGGGGTVDDSPQARKIFHLADTNNDTLLVYSEFEQVFVDFDTDGDDNVTYTEFRDLWIAQSIGDIVQCLTLFTNLDVNRDGVIENSIDMPYIFYFFDRNGDLMVTDGEFVIQWVKIAS